MRSLSQVVSKVLSSGVVALSGAAPQVANGNTFDTRRAAKGSLAAHIDYDIKTTSITYTATWQVSLDGATFVGTHPSNGAADVVLATGSGTDAAGHIVLSAPDCIYAYRYCRLIITTAAASGAGAGHDDVTIAYSYLKSQLGS